nr:zonadhesin 1 [Ephestia kuehniella]
MIMMKTVFLIAFTANVLLNVSIQGKLQSDSAVVSSSSSSAQSNSSSASSTNSSSSGTNQNGDCDKTKCDNPNEEYDPCPAPCPPRECGVDVAVILCAVPPKPGDPECKPGCRCSDNYLRNDEGTCIPKEQCPNNPTCKINEVFSNCTQATCNAQYCSQKGKPVPCILVLEGSCIKGCVCAHNYLRNSNGDCIPEDECPDSCGGDPNAIPGCGVNCGRLCSNYKVGSEVACPDICNLNGCDCKEGFVLDTVSGKCVLPNQCPKSEDWCGGDPNAKPGCGINCGRLCSNYKNGDEVSCIALCKEDGCDCKEGYVYDTVSGRCVLPDQCPCDEDQCNKPNEEYVQCPGCSPGTCESINKTYSCPAEPADPSECKGACRCKPGYYYNKIGDCITESQCLQCNGTHEFYSCGSACDNVCATLDIENRTNCPIINIKCNEKCYCEDGYARNKNNICVPIDECEPAVQCTKPNEEYVQCPSCSPGTCESINKTYSCPAEPADPSECKGACRCIPGYYYDKNGDCVPEDQCPPVIQCNKPNEEYVQCPDCSPGTCESIGKIYHCPFQPSDPSKCTGACRCKSGYFYNKIGECIKKEECLQCKGEHEFFSCGPECDNVCATLDKQNRTNCPIINIQCNKKCYCEDGYARDENNTCIPIDQCKPEPESCKGDPNAKPGCGVNCGRLCSNYKIGHQIGCPAICYPDGCDCKEGYVLDTTCGKCVLPDQCPSSPDYCGGDPNAKPGCGINCGRLCSNYKNSTDIACIDLCKEDGCDCKKGFVLDTSTGICVLPEHCPGNQCTKPNEEYQECANCSPGTCDSIGKSYNCPAMCKGACRCKPGYYYDKNGNCITKEQCCGCKINERCSDCPDAECVAQTCKDVGFPISCPRFANGRCPSDPGCVCNSGYYRNSIGVCVPGDLCPSCGGDPHARPGCGTNCGRLCSNYDKPGVACSDVCSLNGCDCIDGYVYDTNTHKCVLPNQCTTLCGKDEVYSTCVNGGCDKRLCSQLGKPSICIDPIKCQGGCICRKDYLRDSNGVCVPQDQCEIICPEGEHFSNCPPVYSKDCDSEYCPRSRNDPPTCPTTKQCGKPKCVCGYLDKRNRETGKCVRASDCPPFPCDGPNEEYQSCPAGCPGENCTDYLENTQCPKFKIGIVVPCKPACRCLKGFYRNSEGICVDSSKCTECPEGEVYSKCPPTQCDAEYCPISRGDPLTCPTPKKCTRPRCICGFNSHRDRLTGKCIPTSKCPAFPCDGKNEVYDSCPPVCPGQNCTDFINKTTCPKFKIGIVVPCKPDCRCEKDKYRNSKGECVCADECECDD